MSSLNSSDAHLGEASWGLIRVARELSESFHRAKVPKEERAYWVALLCLAAEDGVSLEEGDLVRALDGHAQDFFGRAEQGELFENARVLPTGEAARRCERALAEARRILETRELGRIAGSTDLLGVLFEAFLRYGNGAKELGIVLTPAHVCRFASQLLDVGPDDLVYDPAAGSGAFLVAALRDGASRIYGAEVSPQLAFLAQVNLHLHGAHRGGLRADSCFGAQLRAPSRRAKYPQFGPATAEQAAQRRVTRVLMNPPFSLKSSSELETHFIDHALSQMVPGGKLLAVIPSSILYSGEHGEWRASLLASHRLLNVTLLPADLFYPVATETLLMVVCAWEAHPVDAPVAWARVCDDGYVKRKGFRVPGPQGGQEGELERLAPQLRAWINEGRAKAPRPGYLEYCPISASELLPQAHLGTPQLDEGRHADDVAAIYRALMAQRWDAEARAEGGAQ
jgi:predicted RNA methylase